MPKFSVTVNMTRKLSVYADDEDEACEKAVDIVLKWDGIEDAEATDAEEE